MNAAIHEMEVNTSAPVLYMALEWSNKRCRAQDRTSDAPKATGPGSAWLLVMEFFAWRDFRNRREVAARAGR